jgi:hypothetical protein
MRLPHIADPERFADPRTRRIMSHRWSTTDLLEELLGEPVSVAAAYIGAALPELFPTLRPPPREILLARRTTLATPTRPDVSENVVIALDGISDQVAAAILDRRTPLGRSLRRIPHRRIPDTCGLTRWPHGEPGSAASKCYQIAEPPGYAPTIHVHETFNPTIFGPDLAAPPPR